MVDENKERLIVVEQKLDAILDKLEGVFETYKDHECRLRRLEALPGKRWETIIAALLTGAVGIGIGALATFFAQR